jgi:hypothetical protein
MRCKEKKMHIEPGLVDGSKIVLSYATAATSAAYAAKLAYDHIRIDGLPSLIVRSLVATVLVFVFFEVFPHVPVGVSEVHLILGSSLFLIFGIAPTAIGLAGGLMIQSLFLAPSDLPQLGMNVTTLLAALFVMQEVAKRVVPANLAYVDLSYSHVLKLSLVFQGSIVSWVAFWTIYGQGFSAPTLQSVATFGAAYMTVVLLEPLVDMALLAGAKALRGRPGAALLATRRLYA